MTLGAVSRSTQHGPVADMAAPRDARAAELGKLIKGKRLDLGLNRPSFVREMSRHTEEITPDYLNKLESGAASLARASLEVREGIRIVLGYSREEWHAATGLYASETSSSAERRFSERPPLPNSLLEAAKLYGGRFPDLHQPAWQAYLSSFKPRGARADSPEEWLDLYRDLAKHGITPGGN